MESPFRVAFRGDTVEYRGEPIVGAYHLSSKEFKTFQDADRYKDSIAPSREPIILKVVTKEEANWVHVDKLPPTSLG